MNVRLPKGISSNSHKCPKCGKMMRNFWFGYRCPQCNYEQLNSAGREWNEDMKRVEVI